MPGPLLTKAKVHKLQRLLHMQYKPAEIAAELGITAETVHRTYLPAGVPFTTDENGQIWIVGTEFYQWAQDYLTTRQRKPKDAMKADEAYCVRCNQVIRMRGIREKSRNKRGVVNLSGQCPLCKGQVNRFISGKDLAPAARNAKRAS